MARAGYVLGLGALLLAAIAHHSGAMSAVCCKPTALGLRHGNDVNGMRHAEGGTARIFSLEQGLALRGGG